MGVQMKCCPYNPVQLSQLADLSVTVTSGSLYGIPPWLSNVIAIWCACGLSQSSDMSPACLRQQSSSFGVCLSCLSPPRIPCISPGQLIHQHRWYTDAATVMADTKLALIH